MFGRVRASARFDSGACTGSCRCSDSDDYDRSDAEREQVLILGYFVDDKDGYGGDDDSFSQYQIRPEALAMTMVPTTTMHGVHSGDRPEVWNR